MLLTTQDRFEDHSIGETLGLVRGNTIRARHLGKDILAAFRNVVGGEVAEYTKMYSLNVVHAEPKNYPISSLGFNITTEI